MQSLMKSIKANRNVSTPFLQITSADQNAVIEEFMQSIPAIDKFEREQAAKDGTAKEWTPTPVVSWDRAQGFISRNDAGREALGLLNVPGMPNQRIPPDKFAMLTADPAFAMKAALDLPAKAMLFALNFDLFVKDSVVVQAVCNLRDVFKGNMRMLLMLGSDFDAPTAVKNDVIMLDDPLPDAEGYATIVQSVAESAHLVKQGNRLAKATVDQAILGVKGLSGFVAEQTLSMSVALAPKCDQIYMPAVWDLKVRRVNSVDGLTMTLDGPPLSDLRGLDEIIKNLNDYATGPEAPDLYVLVDEIDKGFAGLGSRGGPGDNTGVTQYMNQAFLTNMENNEWAGLICVGIRGSGKTALAQSIGKAYGKPTIHMDLGAAKDSKLGASEQKTREMFRMIYSIGGKRVCVIATCNKMDVLPPELLRRFTLQTWYFDLLTAQEREGLWNVYLPMYNQPLDSERPNDGGWTGSEIRNCCRNAYRLNKPVSDIGRRLIIPITKSDPKSIEDLRQQADGRFLSVSYEGKYEKNRITVQAPVAKRKLNVGGN